LKDNYLKKQETNSVFGITIAISPCKKFFTGARLILNNKQEEDEMNKLLNLVKYGLTFLLIIPLISCSSGGDGGTGTLGIGLTDTPGDYDHVFVTIKEVQVKKGLNNGESGWIKGFEVNETFDLLELQNGVIADLGLTELEAGKYNQLRLILSSEPQGDHPFANYVVIQGEFPEEYTIGQEQGEYYTTEELIVPSGLQTGIKIVQGFTIEVGGSTELTLDFDAEKSIVQAGNNTKWLLKPTIKVLETVTYSVSGVVDTIEGDSSVPLNGATVSAQTGAPNEIRGTETAVIDGIEGAYKIYLPITQNIFTIVAIMDDYLPQCQILDASIEGIKAYENINFTLDPAPATGTFKASVTGLTPATDSATFSIRMKESLDTCSGVEVASENVINSVDPSNPVYFNAISLPVGEYDLIVEPSNDSQETKILSISIAADTETVENVEYP